ncbi:FtsL-like putative cell division protein [Fluviicola sp.]|uniref:FtsL-like putative cell division protein n=1 Tax=Fluviicola sp. TaxID=1917219 RepID=UPI0031D6F802
MENEYREREENPMDAVRGKSSRTTYSTEIPNENPGKKSSKKTASAKAGPKPKAAAASNVKPKRQNLLIQVLNGEILTRDFVLNNLTFIFFILLLLMLMVAKGYYGKQLQKDITDLQADVDAQTAEYIENKARLEESTSRYRLVQALEKRGLKETVNPVKVIRLKRKE